MLRSVWKKAKINKQGANIQYIFNVYILYILNVNVYIKISVNIY